MDVLCMGKTLTHLQILGCELHQNALGGRAPPGPAGGELYSAPQTIAVITRKEGEGKGCK